jgi:hypothetical protein
MVYIRARRTRRLPRPRRTRPHHGRHLPPRTLRRPPRPPALR